MTVFEVCLAMVAILTPEEIPLDGGAVTNRLTWRDAAEWSGSSAGIWHRESHMQVVRPPQLTSRLSAPPARMGIGASTA